MPKIYTKTGDKGETGLLCGGRVRKNDPRIAAYGDVDELNCVIGKAKALTRDATLSALLKRVQNDLFNLGLSLSAAGPKGSPEKGIDASEIEFLEKEIDRMEGEIPPLREFILPGGSVLAATLHLARAVCRRAERSLVALAEGKTIGPSALAYLNRLSDFLFVLARWINRREGAAEICWEKKS